MDGGFQISIKFILINSISILFLVYTLVFCSFVFFPFICLFAFIAKRLRTILYVAIHSRLISSVCRNQTSKHYWHVMPRVQEQCSMHYTNAIQFNVSTLCGILLQKRYNTTTMELFNKSSITLDICISYILENLPFLFPLFFLVLSVIFVLKFLRIQPEITTQNNFCWVIAHVSE